MKVRILFDYKHNVLKVFKTDKDINVVIKEFIQEQQTALSEKNKDVCIEDFKDIEFWEGGSYDLIKNEDEYDIFIIGDNGIFNMYTDSFEVEETDSDHLVDLKSKALDNIITGLNKVIDNYENQIEILESQIESLRKSNY